jgi:HNH endonuclease
MGRKLNKNQIDVNDKSNPFVRQAIWECHNGLCFYTQKPIKLTDMYVDHILPKSIERNSELKKEKLKEYGLEQDFLLNSLENYVPSCRWANREKSNAVLPHADLALKTAKRLAPEIRRKINILIQNIDLETSKSTIKAYVSGSRQEAEELYNEFTDEDKEFNEQRYIHDYKQPGLYPTYHYSKKTVLLSAFLPRFSDSVKGSCLIVFKTLRIRNCAITLGHEEILDTLCTGRNTSLDLELRKFIVCQDHLDQNIYYIRFGNVRFPLELETLEVLIEIVDDFANIYLNYLVDIDKHSASQPFQPSNHKNGFRLFKIKKGLWNLLMQFSWNFDYDKGTSAWHIFDGRSGVFHIYTPISTERFNSGHHVSIYSEFANNSLYGSSDEVWIVWVPGPSFNEYKNGYLTFSNREFWDASFTYSWLVEELIPYAAYYFSLREDGLLNFFKRKLSSIQSINHILYQNFLKRFNLREYITDGSTKYNFIEINKINTISDLLQTAHKLQLFFTMQRDIIPVGIEHLYKLLESLCICICHSSSDDWHYVRQKLNFVNSDNKENIIQDIQNFSQSYTEKYIRSYILDDIFRSFISALKTSHLNKEEVKTIIDSWSPFIEFYQENILIQRYTNGVLAGE